MTQHYQVLEFDNIKREDALKILSYLEDFADVHCNFSGFSEDIYVLTPEHVYSSFTVTT